MKNDELALDIYAAAAEKRKLCEDAKAEAKRKENWAATAERWNRAAASSSEKDFVMQQERLQMREEEYDRKAMMHSAMNLSKPHSAFSDSPELQNLAQAAGEDFVRLIEDIVTSVVKRDAAYGIAVVLRDAGWPCEQISDAIYRGIRMSELDSQACAAQACSERDVVMAAN